MSGAHEGRSVASTENHVEIQIADQETTLTSSSSQASTSSNDVEIKDATFKDVLGDIEDNAEDNALFNEINETRTNMFKSESHDMIKIQKVPEIMQRNGDLENFFKPRELSIGPIHADDSNLFKKELKLKLVVYFIECYPRDTEYRDLLKEIKNIEGINAYFDAEVIESYTDEELIRLLFLDGCAMLGFIHSYMSQTLDIFNISNGQAFLIQQDLFLLENQIPFRVLEVLMGLDNKSPDETTEWEEEFLGFIRVSNVIASNDSRSSKDERSFNHVVHGTDVKPVHILDLKRRMLISRDDSLSTITKFLVASLSTITKFLVALRYRLYALRYRLDALRHRLSSCAFPFRSYGISLACPPQADVKAEICTSPPAPFNLSPPAPFGRMYQGKKLSFRSVGELKTAGIKFKPTDSLTTISFHTRFFITGQLRLPTLVVDDSTKRKLLNLVAYEMCLPPDDGEECWVASYINLLDLLIDSEQDVKDLRSMDIVRNCLSSDVEVARLINNIGSLCFSPPKDSYEPVKDEVEKHYKRRYAIWMTQVWDTHFSSPWTIIALFVAATLLALTAIQTWYAVHPKN